MWTETPAVHCKNCGVKLTYSPQKSVSGNVSKDDVKEWLMQKRKNLPKENDHLNAQYSVIDELLAELDK